MEKMDAGPVLDALIAIHIMKANKFEGQFVQKVDQVTKTISVGTEWRYLPYSTDIAAAWEECIEWSYGQTAPHAICLAALETLKQ